MYASPKGAMNLRRKKIHPPLHDGEELLESTSGVFDTGRGAFSTWRPCSIYLTDQRLMLSQVRSVVKEFYLDKIANLETVLRPCIAGKKAPQLAIAMHGRENKRYYVAFRNPHIWLRRIAEMIGLDVDRSAAKKT